MSENKESKPRSFRIDDEIAEKFKEISSVISGNQQQTLAKLIEAYEFQAGKAVLTDKKAEIEEFEKYITAITRKYMGSLEDNQNLSQTIRTEFEAQLKSKDTTIQGLQSQLTTVKQIKEEAASKAQMYEDENARLNSVIDSLTKEYNTKMDDLQTMLADKDSLNKALIDSCNELKTKAEGMKKAAEQSGYKKGITEGRQKAEIDCKAQYEEMSRNALEDIKLVIENAEQMKEEMLQKYRNQLKDVAIAIAEKVIQVSLKSSEEVIERMVISATEKLKTREWAKVYIARCDAELMVEGDSALLRQLAHLSDHVKIVVMENETPGTCIIELPDEIIDASASGAVENAVIPSRAYLNNFQNDHFVSPATLSIFSYSIHFVSNPTNENNPLENLLYSVT